MTVLEKKGEASIPEIEKALKGHVRSVSHGIIYTIIDRLGEEYVATRKREAISVRGGRSGKIYSLTEAGHLALKATRDRRTALIDSLSPTRPEDKKPSAPDEKPKPPR